MRFGGRNKELSGGEPSTTNNRMEMMAVLEGLSALNEHCEVAIEIDSQYVKNGITQWIAGWKRKGWKTVAGQPVKNKDLWLKLDHAVARHTVTWRWVKGHAEHADNNRCDELARAAAGRAGR